MFNKDGIAWKDLNILRDGSYTLSVLGKGTFIVAIGEHTFNITLNRLGVYVTPPFRLKEGVNRLKITSLDNGSILMKVKLRSQGEIAKKHMNYSSEDVIITKVERIDPTLWRVNVIANKPFALNFLESYDPAWRAKIYRQGKLIKTVRLLPLYDTSSCVFFIDQTGKLSIEIEYTLQYPFKLGSLITMISFSVLFALLILQELRLIKKIIRNTSSLINKYLSISIG